MSIQVKIPALGESVTQAVLVKWHKQDGDLVARDEALCELETDKANVDLPSPEAGVVRRRAAEGDTVKIDQVIAEIEAPGAAASDATRPAAPPSPGASTIPSGTPTPGRPAEKPPLENSEAAAPDRKLVGDDVFKAARAPAASPALSPAARRIVEERQLQPDQITGTGKGGRITREDAAATAPTPSPAPPSPPPSDTGERGVRREPMSRIRRKIAERLVNAQHTAAILTTFNEVDMSAVQALRARYKERFAEVHGVNLGLMSFFVRASVLALQEFPRVNAAIEGDDIVYHDYVHMGVAVSTERGLAVPVLRYADRLSFAQIESEIKRLAAAAKEGKLAIADLSGGTFTITNGGVFGSLLSTPILNPPQSGILGMHTIQKRPVAVDDTVEVRPMMYLALSYDHRIVDGRESVSFLVRLKGYLEDPARLMLGV